MKKLILSALMAVTLAACGTTGFTWPPTAQSVADAAVATCGFLPTADSIAGLISQSSSLTTAEQIAALICGAVVPAKQAGKLRGTLTTVNGVAIQGKFVTGQFVR